MGTEWLSSEGKCVCISFRSWIFQIKIHAFCSYIYIWIQHQFTNVQTKCSLYHGLKSWMGFWSLARKRQFHAIPSVRDIVPKALRRRRGEEKEKEGDYLFHFRMPWWSLEKANNILGCCDKTQRRQTTIGRFWTKREVRVILPNPCLTIRDLTNACMILLTP